MKPHIVVALVLHKLLDQACPCAALAVDLSAMRSIRNFFLCFKQNAACLTFSDRLCRRGYMVIFRPTFHVKVTTVSTARCCWRAVAGRARGRAAVAGCPVRAPLAAAAAQPSCGIHTAGHGWHGAGHRHREPAGVVAAAPATPVHKAGTVRRLYAGALSQLVALRPRRNLALCMLCCAVLCCARTHAPARKCCV